MPRNKPSPGALRKSRKRVSAPAGRAKKPVKAAGRKASTFSGKPRPGKPSPRSEKGVGRGFQPARRPQEFESPAQNEARIRELLRANYPKVFGALEERDSTADDLTSPAYRVEDLIRQAPIAAQVIDRAIREFEQDRVRLPSGVRDRMAVCMARVWLDALYHEAYGQYQNRSTKGRKLNELKRKKERPGLKNGLNERDDRIYRRFTELKKGHPGKVEMDEIWETLVSEFGEYFPVNGARQIKRIIRTKRMQS
jgi:hypothetical protein